LLKIKRFSIGHNQEMGKKKLPPKDTRLAIPVFFRER
jgi:hypothetical protein